VALKLNSISTRIGGIVALAFVCIGGGGAFSYYNLRVNLLDQKELQLKNEVETAKSFIDSIRQRAEKGEFS
jgi:methyl-accepting chemotaxis protein